MTLRRLRIPSLILVLLLLPALAGAATIAGPYTTTTPIPSTKTDFSGSLSFPQFDPSQGTLLSMLLELSTSLDTVLTVTNSGTLASSGTAKTEVYIYDGLNGVTPVLDVLWPVGGYAYTLNAGQSVVSGLLTKSANSSDTYTDGSVLSLFTGTGTYLMPVSTFTQTVLSNNGGNTDAGQVTHGTLTGTVTYTYTPGESVPEPVTGALLGSALLFLGLLGKRRK